MIKDYEQYEIVYVIIRDIISHVDVKHISLLKKWTLEMSQLSGEELEKKYNELMNEYEFRAYHENGLEYHGEDPMLIIYKLSIIEKIIKIKTGVIKRTPISEPKPEPKLEPDSDIEVLQVDDIEHDLEEDKNKVVRVTRRYRDRKGAALASIGIVAAIIGGMGIVPSYETITKIIDSNQLNYDVTEMTLEDEDMDKSLARARSNIDMGGMVELEDGDVLYDDSLLEDSRYPTAKAIGLEYELEGKHAGDYRVSGFSIVKDGQIIDYIEDFDGVMIGPNLGDYINDVCLKNGLDVNEVNVRIHLGTTPDFTRTGWIDITDLITADDLKEDDIKQVITEGLSYRGSISEFTGDTITLDNGAQIKVSQNGKLLKSGDTVKGSDGVDYVINDLDLESVTKKDSYDEFTGYKLNYNIINGLALGAIPGIAAIVMKNKNKKKNEEAEKTPELFEFENEEEYIEAKRDFEKAKEDLDYVKEQKRNNELQRRKETKEKDRFRRDTLGKKVTGAIKDAGTSIKDGITDAYELATREESFDVMREYSDEQLEEIYRTIYDHRREILNYIYENYGNVLLELDLKNIKFTGGKVIYMDYRKGKLISTADITDVVIPYIAHIGKDNNVVAEGEVTEEFRRKY